MPSPRDCPLCGGSAGKSAFPYATKFNNILFKYLECKKCASIFVDPVPDENTFALMYAKAAYHDQHYEGVAQDAYRASANILKKHLQAGGLVLDFGCGTGGFLKAIGEEGFIPFGVEFDADAAAHASREAKCIVLSVDKFNQMVQKPLFDAIHLGDVLEHLPNPRKTLQELLENLKPGGLIFIEGPLETNPSPVFWSARIFGCIKHFIKPGNIGRTAPTHLFRTEEKSQHLFFVNTLRNPEEKHWEIYETGWPYLNSGKIKNAIATTATFLGGKSFLSFRFGNRFRGLFKENGYKPEPIRKPDFLVRPE